LPFFLFVSRGIGDFFSSDRTVWTFQGLRLICS
jgi:hypothetical protein